MVTIVRDKAKVVELLFDFILSKKVNTSLGEPVVFEENDAFIGKLVNEKCIGFACVNILGKIATLKYFYIDDQHRGNGYFSELLRTVQDFCEAHSAKKIVAVSTNIALPMYQAKGFVVTKQRVNFHTIEKQI